MSTVSWPASSVSLSATLPASQGLLASSPSSSASAAESAAKHPIRRVTHACDFCSYRKRRCDGAQPCANCVRRGRTCEYARPIYKRGPHHAAGGERDKARKERRPSDGQSDSASEGEEAEEQEEYKIKMKYSREKEEREREHHHSPAVVEAANPLQQQHQPPHHGAMHLLPPNVVHSDVTGVEGGESRNALEEEAVALTLALTLPTWKYQNFRTTTTITTGGSQSTGYSAAVQHGKVNKSYPTPLPPTAAPTAVASAALIPACSSHTALPLCTPAAAKLSVSRVPLPMSSPDGNGNIHVSPASAAISPALSAMQLATPTHFSNNVSAHSPAPSTPTPPSVHTSPAQSPSASSASSPAGLIPSQSRSSPPLRSVLSPHMAAMAVAPPAASSRVLPAPSSSPKKRRHAQLMEELRSTVVAAGSQIGMGQKGAAAMQMAGEKDTLKAAIHCIHRLMHMKYAGSVQHHQQPDAHSHSHSHSFPQSHTHSLAHTHNQSYLYQPMQQVSPAVMPMPAPHVAPSLHSSASFPPASTPRFNAQVLNGYPGHGAYSQSMPLQRHYVQAVSDEEWWSGSDRGEDDDTDRRIHGHGHAHEHGHIHGGEVHMHDLHVADEEETEDEKDDNDDRKKKQRFERLHHHRSMSMELGMSECA